jgi:hypothetical protein
MNINQASVQELNLFFKNFFKEKEFDKSDMPFEVLIDALTHHEQSVIFLRKVASITSNLDFNNAPQDEFRKFFIYVTKGLANNSLMTPN